MKKYGRIILLFGVAYFVNAMSPMILQRISILDESTVSVLQTAWILSLFFFFGRACSKFAQETIFPSFTLQLITGIILHDALSPLSSEVIMVVVICTLLAAIILKGGGDEVERRLFAKIALPTVFIAIIGYLVTFFVTLFLLLLIGVEARTAALFAAITGSTDPASLVPTFKTFVFKEKHKKLVDISVAESALNDAVGAIFTGAVIHMIHSGTDISSLGGVFSGVTEKHNLLHLGQEFVVGFFAGLVGWMIMYRYEKQKTIDVLPSTAPTTAANGFSFSLLVRQLRERIFGKKKGGQKEQAYDFAVVLAVPIFTYFLAQCFGGNGFFAAFIAGLLADYNHGNHHFKKTLAAMEVKIESIAKPVIFMMVGAFVSIGDLRETIGMGSLISMLFVFLSRPAAVFISLGLSNLVSIGINTFFPSAKLTVLSINEMLFMCIVRETGVIPIVLAVLAVSEFPALIVLMPLVAWDVIWTLTPLPAVTRRWAKFLGLTEEGVNTRKMGENEKAEAEYIPHIPSRVIEVS